MSETIHVWMLAATALALLVGAAMALVITRSISRPLQQALALARPVSRVSTMATVTPAG